MEDRGICADCSQQKEWRTPHPKLKVISTTEYSSIYVCECCGSHWMLEHFEWDLLVEGLMSNTTESA